MPTYKSRHHGRAQPIVSGRIQSISRYDKFYDMAVDSLQKGQLPISGTGPNALFLRVVNARAGFTPTAVNAQTIPPAAYSSKSLHNRFSGIRLDGKPGHGALYTASLSGLRREMAHYDAGNTGGLVLPGKTDRTKQFMRAQTAGSGGSGKSFFAYMAMAPLKFVDLRVSSRALQSLFARIASAGKRRYQLAEGVTGPALVRSMLSSEDTSSSRGFADGIFDYMGHRRLAGIMADSARADSDWGLIHGEFGGQVAGTNYVFIGPAGRQIAALKSIGTFDSYAKLATHLSRK